MFQAFHLNLTLSFMPKIRDNNKSGNFYHKNHKNYIKNNTKTCLVQEKSTTFVCVFFIVLD